MCKPVVYTFAVCFFILMGIQVAAALDSCVVPTTLRYNIDEHSQCREVTNNHPSGEDIMVPLKTAAEWVSGGSSFLQNLPTGIRAIQCGDCVIQSGDLDEVGRYKAGGGAPAAQIIDKPMNVFVQGNYAYVITAESDRFTVFNVSDPTNPTFVSSITSTQLENALDVFVQGNYAYVVTGEGRAFVVINISNPASPTQVGFISNANYWNTRALHVSGNYAYVTTHNQDRFAIINISNPAAPSEVSSLTGAYLDGANGIDVVGNYAYIVNRNGDSMTILNVSNPASPSLVDEFTSANISTPTGIKVVGDYAYIASNNTGKALTVIDVSNPASPSEVWSSTDGNGLDVVIKENYAFVTRNGWHSVDVYDISNPLSPVKVDSYRDTVNMTNPDGLHIQGRYIYVPSQTNDSLNIIDIGCDPLAPTTGSSGDSAIALTSCEEWTPPPPPPACGGAEVGGYCWYYGAILQSCDAVCAAQGLSCDLVGTRDYAGSGLVGGMPGATMNAQCNAVLDAVGAANPGFGTIANNLGCHLQTGMGGVRRRGTTTTTCGSSGEARRACACN